MSIYLDFAEGRADNAFVLRTKGATVKTRHLDSFGTYLRTVRSGARRRNQSPGDAQVRLLRELADEQPHALKQLSEASGVSIGQLLDLIDPMIEHKLIASDSGSDVLRLRITPTGKSLVD